MQYISFFHIFIFFQLNSNVVVDDILYDEKDISNSCEKIETVDYHQEVEVEGIKFTGYNAGHVLGAAMFLIEIAGIKLLYTGDYSREEDRHLMVAEKPTNVYTDIMICESTYGVQSLEPRLEREARFTSNYLITLYLILLNNHF